MKHGPITDPELLGLLRAISSDPQSRLMKLATQGIDRGVRRHEAPISEGEPFLTRAERHLLREHREEVALLLYKATQRAVCDRPPEEALVYRSGLDVPSRGVLNGEYLRLSRVMPTDPRAEEELSSFFSLQSGRAETHWSAQEMALGSLRLWPRDQTRIWVGLGHLVVGERSQGREVLGETLSGRIQASMRSMAQQTLAFEALEDGHVALALDAYRSAVLADPSRPEPILGLLHASFFGEARAEALRAASLLSELPEGSLCQCLDDHIGLWQARRRIGAFRPGQRTISFVDQVRGELSTRAAVVADLFAGVDEP